MCAGNLSTIFRNIEEPKIIDLLANIKKSIEKYDLWHCWINSNLRTFDFLLPFRVRHESWPYRRAAQFMCARARAQSNIDQPRNFRNFAICAVRRLIYVLGGVKSYSVIRKNEMDMKWNINESLPFLSFVSISTAQLRLFSVYSFHFMFNNIFRNEIDISEEEKRRHILYVEKTYELPLDA